MPDLFAMGQAVLSSQPFSLLLGAELRLPVSEQLKQQFGFVHGGVLAYLAGNAMTFAGALSLGATAVAPQPHCEGQSPVATPWPQMRA